LPLKTKRQIAKEKYMSINRRHFLINTGIAAGAAGTLSAVGQNSATKSAPKTAADNLQSWTNVREQFDAVSPDYIHLSSFFLASHPRPVREAIEKHRRAIDENPFIYTEENIYTMPGRIQASVAEYVGGKPEEVALTNSTTMGLALVYQGLPLEAEQEILTTTHDHFVHHEAIRLAAERAGATVKKIALFDDFNRISEEEIVARIVKAVNPKTRVVGITWVHSGTGLKLPVRRIAKQISEANRGRAEADRILLLVDGVHGFGVEDETVAELGADFFIAGTHKWIFGPRGTGIIWARADNWKTLRMVFPAFAMETFGAWISDTELKAPMRAAWIGQGGFHAFEYEWALPAAFNFHRRIGRARIAERIHQLNEQCKEELAKMRHVKLYTPRGNRLSAGLICFDVDGMKSEAVVKRLLEKRVIASTAPYKNSYARVAPSLLNTPEEIETTLRHIRALA
jgi:selenocysteine lyase/cysteine desulfurase